MDGMLGCIRFVLLQRMCSVNSSVQYDRRRFLSFIKLKLVR